jgi:hypothetical protein
MVALFRSIETDKPQAVNRTYLDGNGKKKVERRFLGPVSGAAIILDANENVLRGLHIGEGIETCLAARQIGLRPTWALGSCSRVHRLRREGMNLEARLSKRMRRRFPDCSSVVAYTD